MTGIEPGWESTAGSFQNRSVGATVSFTCLIDNYVEMNTGLSEGVAKCEAASPTGGTGPAWNVTWELPCKCESDSVEGCHHLQYLKHSTQLEKIIGDLVLLEEVSSYPFYYQFDEVSLEAKKVLTVI